jgi:hypothetical protein
MLSQKKYEALDQNVLRLISNQIILDIELSLP